MSKPEESKVALITGASRGIGRAIAMELASHGHRIAVNYALNQEAAQETVKQLQDLGCQAMAVQADIAKADQVEIMVKTVREELGPIQILINNAGITRDNLLLMMKPDEWLDVIQTNLNGLFQISKMAAKDMLRKRWGRIINLSSVAATSAGRGQCNYAAAKGGINGFTISLAGELGRKGITVNAIAPGVIETDMSQRVRDLAGDDILKEIVLGRFGRPEEVAALAGFLTRDIAGYITGQVMYVDGGFRL